MFKYLLPAQVILAKNSQLMDTVLWRTIVAGTYQLPSLSAFRA